MEYHPFLDQSQLLTLAEEHDLLITAYSPLAHGKVPDDSTLHAIGEAHGKTAGQVALRWLLDQPRVSPIPKASSHQRRQENFEVLRLRALRRGARADRRAPEGRAHRQPALGAGLETTKISRPPGAVAEWLRSGLQSRVHRFDSGRRL